MPEKEDWNFRYVKGTYTPPREPIPSRWTLFLFHFFTENLILDAVTVRSSLSPSNIDIGMVQL